MNADMSRAFWARSKSLMAAILAAEINANNLRSPNEAETRLIRLQEIMTAMTAIIEDLGAPTQPSWASSAEGKNAGENIIALSGRYIDQYSKLYKMLARLHHGYRVLHKFEGEELVEEIVIAFEDWLEGDFPRPRSGGLG